jgi:hypothetical protein
MGINGADIPFLCEVQFFETLGGVESMIDPTGKTIIYDVLTSGQSAAFDGVTNANAGATGPSTALYHIGLDLGA